MIAHMTYYKAILAKNIDGVVPFIVKMVSHSGSVNIKKLHVVAFKGERPLVRRGRESDKKTNYSLLTGGDIVNSFSPLYEIEYLFISLFLAGVGTAVINKKWLQKYKKLNKKVLLREIMSDLETLTEEEIFSGLRHPVIGIISRMDTDLVPMRYFKHQLWRLDPSVLTKRVADITLENYGNIPPPLLNPKYWTAKDQEIADIALQYGASLKEVKAIQYYLTVRFFLNELGIDIKNLPIFFNFSPKEAIVANGASNSFLKILLGLHTHESRIKYRKIIGIDSPWIISKACQQCKQGDKRILSSKLMSDGKTVKVHCKPHEFAFRNEHGDSKVIKGCGYKFTFTIPDTTHQLYAMLKSEDVSVHFAARELMTILRDSPATPIGLVATDLGIIRDVNGKLTRDVTIRKGYGDNLDMFISALYLQQQFIAGNIVGEVSAELKWKKLLMPQQVGFYAYDMQSQLLDTEVTTLNKLGKVVGVSDTSALKAIEKGLSVKEMFEKAVRIYSFTLEELLALKTDPHQTEERHASGDKKFSHLTSGSVSQI